MFGYKFGCQEANYIEKLTENNQITKQADNPQLDHTITTDEPSIIPTKTTNTANNPTVIPDNYVNKETLCYKYAYPPEFRITQDNSCYQLLQHSNTSYVFSIIIEPLYEMTTQDLSSLDNIIANRTALRTIVQSEDMLIDNVQAKQIIEKDPNSPVNMHQIRIFVYLPNKYGEMGRNIVGFEVNTNYNEFDDAPETIQMKKDILKNIISSNVWK